MRHLKSGRKLNRKAPHRKAMLANLATSLFDKERVKTTLPRAKEVRGVAERLITYAKRGGLANLRLAAETVKDKTILKKLFDEIGPTFKERNGGYCRILRMQNRVGDCAPMCMIELVGTTEKLMAVREAVAVAGGEAPKKPARKSAKSKDAVSSEEKLEGVKESAPKKKKAEEKPKPAAEDAKEE